MKENKNLHSHEQEIISWIAPEYIQHEKTQKWYIIAGILGIIITIISFSYDNWSMGLVIITLMIVYNYIDKNHPAKLIKIIITNMGIRVGKMFFPYQEIKAFWIIYTEHHKTLNLSINGRIYSDITIQLNNQSPVEVRDYLINEIPELEGKHENFTDVISRLLKL